MVSAYYSKRFPEGRKNTERSFRAAIEFVLANPFVGTAMEGKPARQFPVLRTPFMLIYAIEDDSIDIIRVWDARADPARLNEK
jgi:plasmid stabilization system protein ParE